MRPGRHIATTWMRLCLAAWLVARIAAHVPTYSGAKGNSSCYTPPHHHDTSQVIYVRGSGGLEIHCSAESCPFDYANGEILDVDAVFRDEVDQSTYALYIGCIGCMPDDPINIAPVPLSGYEPGELEPFTQTSYRSVYNKTERKYDSTLLDPSTCADGHFGIRLVQFPNASKDIVWGAVIGLGETFTLEELLSFPIFVLNNHGQTWNELPWTYYVILALTPVLTFADRWGMQRLGYGAWTPPSIWDRGMGDPRVEPTCARKSTTSKWCDREAPDARHMSRVTLTCKSSFITDATDAKQRPLPHRELHEAGGAAGGDSATGRGGGGSSRCRWRRWSD